MLRRHKVTNAPTRWILVVCLTALTAASPWAQTARTQPASILDYISRTWADLTRSNKNLVSAAPDPKFPQSPPWPVYISQRKNLQQVQTRLRREMNAGDWAKIEVRALPEALPTISPQGLLYLPRPYVVPGGRFNEMYGWDSYFIQVGLLRDHQNSLAKDMAEDFLYEIRDYGKILNANRTYYLTRSQPPFLTEMLLGAYQRTHDRKWLQNAVPAVEQYYRYWTSGSHLTPETGLSRYWDSGEGPAPEVLASEHDAQGRTHYDDVKEYFRTHEIKDYDVAQFFDSKTDQLTPLFYKGDRSMRESGFDPSNRFGPFGADIINYNPVCLNSLLYLMEKQTAEIMRILGRGAEAITWDMRAQDRAARINRLLWDAQDGLYYDYDFATGRVRKYPFLTTFYPLWAGIASREQAAQVMRNLPKFEKAGGLETSTNESGSQWDAPFGWAPLELIADQGMRRYGYRQEADRTAIEFLSLVLEEYRKHGTIVEKYDVVRRTSDLGTNVRFGYRSNEIGFGWTNAAFTALFDQLRPEDQRRLLAERP